MSDETTDSESTPAPEQSASSNNTPAPPEPPQPSTDYGTMMKSVEFSEHILPTNIPSSPPPEEKE
jgi:hypothetical protein